MLSQKERVLGYTSWALTKPEKNYCVTRRELLGMIFGIRKYRAYLAGAHFTIRTDQRTLRWLLDAKEPEVQMVCWIQELGPGPFSRWTLQAAL